MINNVTLKIKTQTEIIWSILFLIVLRILGYDDQLVVVLALLFIVLISLKAKKIFLPQINGLKIYMVSFLIALFYGLIQYEMRDIAKSLFYTGGSIVLIYLAFIIQSKYKNKSIIKTLYVGGVIIVIQSMYVLLQNFSQMKDIDDIRQLEGPFIYEVSALFIVLFIEKAFYKKIIFGRVTDYVIMSLYIVKIALSLSRSGLGQVAIEVIVALICVAIADIRKLKPKVVAIMVLLTVVFITVFSILPEDSVEEFNDKFDKTSEEINANQEFNSVADAMHNWRAYEIYEAKKQWRNSNGFEMIFGEGMGSAVRVRFVPLNWGSEMLDGNKVPLLHNGYYSMLIIGGILGVAAIIVVFLSPLMLFFINRKRTKIQPYLIAAASTSAAMLFCTYVVNGIVTRTIFFNWCMIYGCAYALAIEKDDEGDEQEEVEN